MGNVPVSMKKMTLNKKKLKKKQKRRVKMDKGNTVEMCTQTDLGFITDGSTESLDMLHSYYPPRYRVISVSSTARSAVEIPVPYEANHFSTIPRRHRPSYQHATSVDNLVDVLRYRLDHAAAASTSEGEPGLDKVTARSDLTCSQTLITSDTVNACNGEGEQTNISTNYCSEQKDRHLFAEGARLDDKSINDTDNFPMVYFRSRRFSEPIYKYSEDLALPQDMEVTKKINLDVTGNNVSPQGMSPHTSLADPQSDNEFCRKCAIEPLRPQETLQPQNDKPDTDKRAEEGVPPVDFEVMSLLHDTKTCYPEDYVIETVEVIHRSYSLSSLRWSSCSSLDEDVPVSSDLVENKTDLDECKSNILNRDISIRCHSISPRSSLEMNPEDDAQCNSISSYSSNRKSVDGDRNCNSISSISSAEFDTQTEMNSYDFDGKCNSISSRSSGTLVSQENTFVELAIKQELLDNSDITFSIRNQSTRSISEIENGEQNNATVTEIDGFAVPYKFKDSSDMSLCRTLSKSVSSIDSSSSSSSYSSLDNEGFVKEVQLHLPVDYFVTEEEMGTETRPVLNDQFEKWALTPDVEKQLASSAISPVLQPALPSGELLNTNEDCLSHDMHNLSDMHNKDADMSLTDLPNSSVTGELVSPDELHTTTATTNGFQDNLLTTGNTNNVVRFDLQNATEKTPRSLTANATENVDHDVKTSQATKRPKNALVRRPSSSSSSSNSSSDEDSDPSDNGDKVGSYQFNSITEITMQSEERKADGTIGEPLMLREEENCSANNNNDFDSVFDKHYHPYVLRSLTSFFYSHQDIVHAREVKTSKCTTSLVYSEDTQEYGVTEWPSPTNLPSIRSTTQKKVTNGRVKVRYLKELKVNTASEKWNALFEGRDLSGEAAQRCVLN